MKNYCIIDIETVPDNLPTELRPKAKLGNVKDPAKIAEKETEHEAESIKIMSLHPAMCKIVHACVWSSDKEDFVVDTADESEAISQIFRAMLAHDTVVGYNHISFDLPVWQTRALILEKPSWPLTLKRYSNNPYYDCCQILAGWEREKMKSLDWWAKRLGLSEPIGSGADVYKWYSAGDKEAIRQHCRQDVKITNELYLRIKEYWG